MTVHAGIIGVFALPAVAVWWRAWAGGPSTTVRCNCLDPGQQVWFVAWPAYALAHGLDPLFTDFLWPPHGVNLLDNASGPLIGLTLSPLTWAAGPVAATTVALTLVPALSAWGCFVACRRFVAWRPAAWVAGFLFGYSPFVVENVAQGHLDLGLLVFPALMVVVLHEILVRRRWSAARCGLALGALVVLQFFVSAEVLAMTVVLAVVGTLVAALLSPGRVAGALPSAARALGLAGVLAAVVLAWPVVELATGPQHIRGSIWSGFQAFLIGRLYNLWSPGHVRTALWPGAVQGPVTPFLGVGALVLVGTSVAMAWRRRSSWVMATVALAATVCSWGGIFWSSPGHAVVSTLLPWGHLFHLPVLEDASPMNFAGLADLAAALVVGLGLDAFWRSGVGRRLRTAGRSLVVVGATALAAAPIWLTYGVPLSVQPLSVPRWYRTAALRVPLGSVVTSYPFPASAAVTAEPLVWQAVDGMRFRLAGGYVKVPPAHGQGVMGPGDPGSAVRVLHDLTLTTDPGRDLDGITPAALTALRQALAGWHTSFVVVVDRDSALAAAALFTAAIGETPVVEQGAFVWDLRARPAPAAVDASAAVRSLAACSKAAPALGSVPKGTALPQDLNRCVVGRTGA